MDRLPAKFVDVLYITKHKERGLYMSFLSRMIDRRIEAYQSELIRIHYAEVENMYRQIRGWRHDYRNNIQVINS